MIAVHIQNKEVSIRRKPCPRRPPGYALLRLHCGGICNTDIELQLGYYGFRGTPGHEFVGEVLETDDKHLIGRAVVGEINIECGRCAWCKQDLGRHCPKRSVLGIVRQPGAFSNFFVLPEKNLHPLPPSMPAEQAVFTEPVAAACEILEQVRIPRKAPLAVLGDGKLGLLVAQVLQAHGADVHLFGHHRTKLAVAAKAGIGVEILRKTVPQAAYDYVVEATGSASGLSQTIQMVRPRGTVIMKSTIHGSMNVDMASAIVNEITFVGSRCGPFKPALELLRCGKVRVEDMISGRFALADAPEAFRAATAKGALKILLIPEESL